MAYNPPGSSVCGILQARILEWIAMVSSWDLPDPGIEHKSLMSPALAEGFFKILVYNFIFLVLNLSLVSG